MSRANQPLIERNFPARTTPTSTRAVKSLVLAELGTGTTTLPAGSVINVIDATAAPVGVRLDLPAYPKRGTEITFVVPDPFPGISVELSFGAASAWGQVFARVGDGVYFNNESRVHWTGDNGDTITFTAFPHDNEQRWQVRGHVNDAASLVL